MMKLLRPILAVLLVTLAVVALPACGSSDDHSAGDATSLIKQTFGPGHPIRSGRIDATLNVDLKGFARLNGPIGLHITGPFQSNGGKRLPDFAFDLDLTSGTQPVTVGAVFAQGAGYFTIEGQAFDLGKDLYAAFVQGYAKAKADSGSGSGAAPSLSALGIQPVRWLKDPQDKGTEDIAGTKTDHVTAGVDIGRLLDDISTLLGKARGVTGAAGANVPTQLTATQRDAIERSVKSARVDVWTGQQDRTLRRVALDVAIDVPAELRAKAGGLSTGHIGLSITLAQLNQRQKIVKPSGARPIGELRSALQQLGLVGTGSSSSSGSSSGSGSSGTSTTQSSATPSGPQSDYTKCLQSAGEDLAKVQRCAELLQ